MPNQEKTYIRKLNISIRESLQLGTLVGYIIRLYHPCDHTIKHIDIRDNLRPSRFDDPAHKLAKRVEAMEYLGNLELFHNYIVELHIDNFNRTPCDRCSELREKSVFELIDDLINFQSLPGKRFWDSSFITPEKLPLPPQAYERKSSYLNIHIEDAVEFCKQRYIKLCFKEYVQEKFVPLSYSELNKSKIAELEQKLDSYLDNLSMNKRSQNLDRHKPPLLVEGSKSLTNIAIHLSWLLYCDGVDSPSPDAVFDKLKKLAQECMDGEINSYFSPLDSDDITKITGIKIVKSNPVIEWSTSSESIKKYTYGACKKTVNEWKRKMSAINWVHFDS